jgi:hypothetical protein
MPAKKTAGKSRANAADWRKIRVRNGGPRGFALSSDPSLATSKQKEAAMDTTNQAQANRDEEVSSDAVREMLEFEAIELKAENVDGTAAGYGCGGNCG